MLGRWLLVGSCSLALLSCTACGGSGKTVVPELRGKTITQASRLLAERHLCSAQQIPIHAAQTGGHVPIVDDQDPRPGTRVDRDTSIFISARAGANAALYVDSIGPCPY